MTKQTLIATLAASAVAAGAAAATSGAAPEDDRGLPQGSESVTLNPADFTIDIDNPYWPMKPGNTWVYAETNTKGARERVVVTVTNRTKRIANGVQARVIRDVVTEKGRPVETTDDWYAQDKAGNIWYLGGAVINFKDGRPVSREGSFEAGVDGAQAGVAMPADPVAGLSYRQEYGARAELIRLQTRPVAAGRERPTRRPPAPTAPAMVAPAAGVPLRPAATSSSDRTARRPRAPAAPG